MNGIIFLGQSYHLTKECCHRYLKKLHLNLPISEQLPLGKKDSTMTYKHMIKCHIILVVLR